MDERYDVVVVGGGAAGLGAALALSRARRSVLVVDAGAPRNAPAGHVHNYLGREGTPPGELLAIGREEVAAYGAHVVSGTVSSARALDDEPGEHGVGFALALADGASVRARRLLVTAGLVDELPDVPGVAERWGRDVLHCPYCHGWEVRDQSIGVRATGPMSVHQALLFRQWTADLTFLQHTAGAPTDAEREQLAARGIAVVEGEVERLEVDEHRLVGARLRSGDLVPLQAVVVAPFFRARTGVLESLGLLPTELEMGGHVVATYVKADAMGATDVPGVWAAGNVADPRAQVITAAAGGLTAAAAINADLVAEDTSRAVALAATRHGHDHASRPAEGGMAAPGPDVALDEAFWDGMYQSRGGRWSGQPNPQLVAETAALAPGTALDAGCGEGADALWLAQRGWQVTAVDISPTALARAQAAAAAAGPDVAARITWIHADLTGDVALGRYDLVTAQFVHVPSAQRQALQHRLAAAVSPGGTLLVVGHHPSDVHAGVGRWNLPDLLFTSTDVVAGLEPDSWEVTVDATRQRAVTDDEGAGGTVHDTVVKARRHAA